MSEERYLNMKDLSNWDGAYLLKTSMSMNLADAFKNLDLNERIVHMSHSDLDGYGCTILSELASFVRPDQKPDPNGVQPVIPRMNKYYSFFNHSDLKKEAVYDRIARIFTEVSCDQNHRHLTILITDIGGVTIDELVSRFRYANHGDVHFYIVDHHRHEYPKRLIEECEEGKKTGGKTYIYTYDGICYAAYRDGLFKIDVMQTSSNMSATLGLHRLLACLFSPIRGVRVRQFAELVSKYDTGHWGNWKVDEIRYMDDNNRIMAIDENVNEEILLQMYYKHCSQLCGKKKNPADLLRFQCRIVAALWTGNRDIAMSVTIKTAVYDSIIEMNLNYIRWVESLKRVHRNSSDEPFEVMDGVLFNMPHTEAWDQVMDIDVWPITEENAADIKLPFSMYAKEYLENDPNATKLLMKVETTKYHSCDMRSADDKYNCYEIAKINGGGGHPRAAGFPMPEVKK